MESSPLRVAASLIQSLDIAHTEMTSFAADAAADAEKARRNARTAQEIARRYQNRSYPTFKLDALDVSTSADASSPSFKIRPRPKHPEVTKFPKVSSSRKPALNGFKHQNGEEKENEKAVKEGNKNDDDGDDKNTGVYVTTPVVSKQSPIREKASISVPPRLGFPSPTSYERIAQQHADDVLQLSMELEKMRQTLKSEQRLRKDCESSLASMKAKKKKRDNVKENLLEKHETERNQLRAQISELEQELNVSRLRLQAAEEDAQLALDLAKDSAEQRDKIEESLLKSQEEFEKFKKEQGEKQQLATVVSPKRSVHFADSDDNRNTDCIITATPVQSEITTSPITTRQRENGPPRSMIAAGRQLLLRRTMTPQDAVIRLQMSPTKSAERRRQLCRRLNEHLNEDSSEDASVTLLSSSPSRTPLSPTPGSNTTSLGDVSSIDSRITKKKFDEYQAALKILQISGKRLELDGHYWRDQSKTISSNNPIQIDAITRTYCQNVEVCKTQQYSQCLGEVLLVILRLGEASYFKLDTHSDNIVFFSFHLQFKINRQQKDINQLESLCGYLEKKLFMNEEPAGC